ncbi:hypothetical protein K432DRAFT_429967 [Lepidopterella palustris CBS 459.81]|uniref:Kelch repeat protein n=1 Tax=Lepidopterella palustris CBS 459.81 TaxID=1314670 RepID=A0A8E2J9Q5_9PEZI|nr:hypothetical protein K432DRAFT_429967 [Lepidopterella palustris CBS 459.81]
MAFIFWAVLFISNQCVAQLDPVINMCSRWQHSSTVKNDVLYIDGGIETFRLNSENYTMGPNVPNTVGVNENTITVLMNSSWNWWTNITETSLNKSTNPTDGSTPPTGIIRGAFYQGLSSDPRVFTFGGTSYMGNQSFPGWRQLQSSATPLWSYDTLKKVWEPFSSPLTVTPNYGFAAEAADQGLAFYLNGQIDNGTMYTTNYLVNNTLNLPGMVVIDMINQTFANISTPGLTEGTWPRVGGVMEYVPSIGRSGVLVALGGAYRNTSGPGNFSAQSLATFDTVDVFDIASYLENHTNNGTWYSQSTSGSIPPPRIDSCVVLASAPDNSSHNIYLYGGRDPTTPNITLYDDIYALSLPSFIWTNIYGPGSSPRWGHTCHIVGAGKRQLLTVGGSLNKTLNDCDWEVRGVAIYDLSAALWGTVFNANAPAYNVTPAIVKAVGGTANGSATVKEPVGGYNNTALAAVMSATRTTSAVASASSTTSATSSPKRKPHAGEIVGAVIGSLAFVAIAIGAVWYTLHRRHIAASRIPPSPVFEATTAGEKAEMEGDAKHRLEAPGHDVPWELDAKGEPQELSPISLTEMDASQTRTELEDTGRKELDEQHGRAEAEPGSVTLAAELSGTAVPVGVRLGVPVIEVNGPVEGGDRG